MNLVDPIHHESSQSQKMFLLGKAGGFCYGYDPIYLFLQLLVQFLPNAYSDQAKQEFGQLIIDASLLSQEEQSDFQRTTEFLENSQLSRRPHEIHQWR